jgi:hypothetical protein
MSEGERIPPVSDENARLQEAFAGLGETATPRPDCPPADRLWAVATGEAPVEERHEIIAHMATCASCASAFRLARGLAEEKKDAAVLRGPWTRWRPVIGALAAILLLAIVVPGLWRSQPSPYRGGQDQEIRSLLDDAVLSRDHAELRWNPGPAGTLYEVRVLTRDGAEIAVESDLEAPRYQIPASALAEVPAGAVLYWQVKALYPDGKSSASKTFEVKLQ